MRRFFATFCTFALLIAAAPASGQIIGLKFGLSSSIFGLNPNAPQGRLTEFSGGGFIRFGFGDVFLQGEVLAVTKGSHDGLAQAAGFSDSELQVNYIEVPLTALLALGKGYIFAGPALAFETDCAINAFDFINDEHVSVNCDEDPTVDFLQHKSVDFGLTGGLGYQIPVGPGAIVLEGRYTVGLTDISESNLQSVKNRAFLFLLGFAVTLGEH